MSFNFNKLNRPAHKLLIPQTIHRIGAGGFDGLVADGDKGDGDGKGGS